MSFYGPLAHERIARVASHWPQRVAIEHRGQRWTYQQLWEASLAVGQMLRQRGVQAGSLVGICLPRSAELIAAQLGTLLAGGAFVPLDPTYPHARLNWMVEDAQPAALITADWQPNRLTDDPITIVSVHECLGSCTGRELPTWPGATADDPAYAIFTSGSTGRPKAVLLHHAGLANLVCEQMYRFGVAPHSRVLQFASTSFDAAVSEIFVTLASGATLCVCDELQLTPGLALAETLQQLQITDVTLPPSVLARLGSAELPALRTLVVAGEACSAALAGQWSRGRRMINAYGPTEATVCATTYGCPSGLAAPPWIGTPLANVTAVVLDANRCYVPPDAAQEGELFLGGIGVARGYLGRADLTAERFVSLEHIPQAKGIFYRTGDLVRWRAAGNLEYLGRIDDQVKIHGIRVEPEEIAHCLRRHPHVRDAIVLPTTRGSGESRLIAFVLRQPGSQETMADLRVAVRGELPLSHWPTEWIEVDSFPLTTNGKLDRGRLLQRAAQRDGTGPGTGLSCQPYSRRWSLTDELAALCREVLGNDLPCDADFFLAGGDSLAAMDLLSRIQRRFGAVISLASFVRTPTIDELARRIQEPADRAAEREYTPLVPLRVGGTRAPLYCVHPGGGQILCYRALAAHLSEEQPVFGLQARGLEGDEPPLRSVEEIAEEYIEALVRHRPQGPYHILGWSFGGLVAYEMACRLRKRQLPMGRLFVVDSAPLYSFVVVRNSLSGFRISLRQMLRIDRQELREAWRPLGETALLVPENASDQERARTFDVFMSNVEAALRYRPEAYTGQMYIYLGEEPLGGLKHDVAAEWRPHCQDLHVAFVPGNHLTMIHAEHVGLMAAHIQDALNQVSSPSSFQRQAA